MNVVKDETGQQYGDWTVVERVLSSKKWARWKCRCKCGDEHIVPGYALRKGLSTKCRSCANTVARGLERKPMIGQAFGRWTVIRRAPHQGISQAAIWWCRCECGVEKTVRGNHLRGGSSRGCMACHGRDHRRESDMVGRVFGRWTVKALSNERQSGAAMYACVCECGKESFVRGVRLRSGHSTGCASCAQPAAVAPPAGLIDMTGARVGSWTVIEQVHVAGRSHLSAMWLCRCACGFVNTVASSQLRAGKCLMCNMCRRNAELEEEMGEMIGKRFGKWTVVDMGPSTARHGRTWVCLCECGRTDAVRANNLNAGQSNSCSGCRRRGKTNGGMKMQKEKRLAGTSPVDVNAAVAAYRAEASVREAYEALTVEERSAPKLRPLRVVKPLDPTVAVNHYKALAANFRAWQLRATSAAQQPG